MALVLKSIVDFTGLWVLINVFNSLQCIRRDARQAIAKTAILVKQMWLFGKQYVRKLREQEFFFLRIDQQLQKYQTDMMTNKLTVRCRIWRERLTCPMSILIEHMNTFTCLTRSTNTNNQMLHFCPGGNTSVSSGRLQF